MVTAGVIGLGQVGGGVAVCLARAGLLVASYDIRPDAAAHLPGVPRVAPSPAALARRCDVVVIAVVDAAQVSAVLEGADGVLAAARPGLSLVLLATVALNDLTRLRARAEAVGVPLIDSGVAGGARSADKGIVALVGATDADLAKVRPVLDGFARDVIHMGGPGAGMAAKIARNAVAIGCLRAGYEGALLARAAGVDLSQLVKAMDATLDAGIGPMMLVGRSSDTEHECGEASYREAVRGMMLKDIAAALQLGSELDVALPLLELTRDTSYAVTGSAGRDPTTRG